ncbi:MAG: DNA ligase D [Chitinophagaceae bacterium]
MSLSEYIKKRSFSSTPEPTGKKPSGSGDVLLFVIQKHDASHLHYDFRLEMKGTLKSWAVPKGPSMNPDDKRLAMLVEDHPFDYKDFEGTIPKGNYGAGTVIIWDQGTYEPAEAAKTKAEREKILLKGFFSGSLRIKMKGEKCKGEFALVRSKNGEENAWLLIKKTDEYSIKTDITIKNKSVVSGKTVEQVAADKQSKTWISNRSSDGKLKPGETIQKSAASRTKKTPSSTQDHETVTGSFDFAAVTKTLLKPYSKKNKSALPLGLKPMLATLIDEPFDDPEWIFEVKWDGYRTLAFLNKGEVELRSRNNNSFNEKFYPVYNALKLWPVDAVVDGEIIVLNDNGLSRFSDLQAWQSEADGELVFYVFDIVWLAGINLSDLPLTERRKMLAKLLPEEGIIRMSENFEASGSEFFEVAQQLGLEGIIAKKADSVYTPDNRTRFWLKIKTEQRHEAIIAGYTLNEDSRKKFSALILGVYENDDLKFIGQAGTGFTDSMQKEILERLRPLEIKACPFSTVPVINKPTRFRRNPPKADVTWVKPELVCEVRYQELTSEGIMRHASFQGLREDKQPKEIIKEEPVALPDLAEEIDKPKGKKEKTPAKESLRKTFLHPKEETQTRQINGRELQFTNLGKLYWPEEKISKRDMLNYYYQVAPYMLPYMKDRPQSLNRHPNGINGESFYQKNVAGKVDEWITTHAYENTTREGNKTFFVCTDEASLLYIAKLGCIEMNPWHSRISAPDNPDWCVIDLDPDTNPFEQVIEAARVVHKILQAIDVPSYPKTSGSTGIHIYIPLGAKYDYEQSKQLAELIVHFAHQELGGFSSLERNPAKRKGKIYLDFLQNRAIQTIAAPYSLRPKPGATASAPLRWEEVKKGLRMTEFTIFTMLDRIKNEGDLFKGVLGKGIDLEKVLKKISTVFG